MNGIAESPWIKSSVSLGLVYNTIDDMKNPHDGIYSNVSAEFAGLGGDAQWVKLTGRASVYQTLSEQLDLVGLLTVGGGHIEGYGSNDLRVFDYFQSNDRMIRGFEYGGIGPIAAGTSGDHLGGDTYFNASAETQFPMPVIPESFGLRGAVFADAATLYGNNLPQLNGVDQVNPSQPACSGAPRSVSACCGHRLSARSASTTRSRSRRNRPTSRRNSTSAYRPVSDRW